MRGQALRALVTGGSGLLGSHIAEQLVRRGDQVRAIVRPSSDARFLEDLGAEIVRGDLTDPKSSAAAVRDVDVVFHAAAKVGDWGTKAEFQSGVVDATTHLAVEALRAGVARFVQISSTSAYGHPREGCPPIVESASLGQNLWPLWDYYTWSKVESERFLWRSHAEQGLPLTVIRPSWLFGERDRTTVARLVERLTRGQVKLLGTGDNPLSAIDAALVAEASILAAEDPGSIGEAYNITDQGSITQAEYFNLWAKVLGLAPIRKRVPYRLAFAAGFAFEAIGRATGRKSPPLITRYAAWLMGRDLSYSTEKARTRLGWRPSRDYAESIARAARWLKTRAASGDR